MISMVPLLAEAANKYNLDLADEDVNTINCVLMYGLLSFTLIICLTTTLNPLFLFHLSPEKKDQAKN